MSAMGRAAAEYEAQLMLKQEAAEEMYAILLEFESTGYISPKKVRAALDKAEGR